MSITHRNLAGNVYLVEVDVPLNVTRAEKVKRCFGQMAGKGIERVVVDLTKVPFIDGPGLQALLAGYKLFGRENFRLVGLQTQPKLVLELTGFEQYFAVSATRNIEENIEMFETLPGYMLALEPRTMALVDMAA